MNPQKIVKYYDYIHKRWRYIEVNDDVYRYFDSLKKQRKEKRKSRQRLFEESAGRSVKSKVLKKVLSARTGA